VVKGNNPWPESSAYAIADVMEKEQASVLLIGGTLRGKDIAAKIAAKLQAGLVTDALGVKAETDRVITTRLMYGGLAVCEEAVAFPALVTIAPRTYNEPASDGGKQGEVVAIEVTDADTGVVVKEVCPIIRQGADLATASRVVGVGRGIAKQEDLKLAEDLAQALGAELGCTRGIAEDYHWLPSERYIGISGAKVKAELYVAAGISGQVQHVVGVRDSKIIVAIDTNEKAPIFEAADYGIVGDLYEVLPLLTAALKK
jgi:electron transfer flavoprotein alpha subunit